MKKDSKFRQSKSKQKRLIRAIKIFFFFAFIVIGTNLSAETNSQTVRDVFNRIEKNSEYIFFYLDKSIDLNRKVSVNTENGKVEHILDQVFEGTNNTYTISNRQIIISKKDAPAVSEQNQKKLRTISGSVKDDMGPIAGANILVKGTTHGCITDADGNFTLEEVPEGAVIQVSYIGFLPQEIASGNQALFNIVLKEDNQALDEVVVVGYGAVRKADLAGSVSVMDSKSFKDQPITQVSDAIQGRVSGVQVENSSVPGGNVKIRIRGAGSINRSNDPLYVIDGIVRESGLTGINPDDIQSMQVLKDASSTAIYGSRGSNGVVLITTKTGKVNHREITFDAQVGVSSVYHKYDILSPYEYATALREIKFPNAFTEEEMNAYKNGTAGIDWQDEIFRTGVTQNYKLAISNGNKDVQYYLSANYMGQQGVVDETSNKRYQVRANVTSDVTSWLHVTADVNASHNLRKGNDFSMGKGNPVWIALNYSPTMTMMDDHGNYTWDPYNSIAANPKGKLKLESTEYLNDVVNGRLDLRFNILPGLTFTTTNGIDYNDEKNYSFSTKKVETASGMGNGDTYRLMLQSSNNLTYMGKWNDHSLTVTGVYEATSTEGRYLSITGKSLLTESVGWWDVNMATSHQFENKYYKWGLMSGVGRAMYNYADRYMLTATFRADGSSKFQNKKWGYFPSVAVAWNLGNEAFMKKQQVFQDAKIRASFGLVGNQAIDPYETLGLMKRVSYGFGSTNYYTGYWSESLATPDLTWEKTRQLDLGLDVSMLNRRLNISLDYFYKKTVDGLLQKTIPYYDGGGSYWVNAGEISNKGLDFSITGHIFQGKDLNWTTTVTGTYIKNEVLSLAGSDFLYGAPAAHGMVEEVTIVKPGEPIGSFYGYVWEGLDEKGNNVYADLNNSGGIDAGDRTVIGKSTPDFTLGWNNMLSWKNWDLNVFFTGSFGAKKLNLTRFTMASMVGDSKFITLRDAYVNGFDKVGAGAEYASLTSKGNTYQPASTQWLENANYFRLDNISLSYNLPKKTVKFADLRLTVSCQNLFTITSYKGFDPSSSAFAGSGNSVDINSGVDIGAYPTPRTWTFGVRMNF